MWPNTKWPRSSVAGSTILLTTYITVNLNSVAAFEFCCSLTVEPELKWLGGSRQGSPARYRSLFVHLMPNCISEINMAFTPSKSCHWVHFVILMMTKDYHKLIQIQLFTFIVTNSEFKYKNWSSISWMYTVKDCTSRLWIWLRLLFTLQKKCKSITIIRLILKISCKKYVQNSTFSMRPKSIVTFNAYHKLKSMTT